MSIRQWFLTAVAMLCALAAVGAADAELAPVGDFSASITSGAAPLTVQFTDLSANAPTSWLWDFGDGATSRDQHPRHHYVTPGTYSAQLLATNAAGSGGAAQTIVVYPTGQETLFPLWKSPSPHAVAVNPGDSSLWVASEGTVQRVSPKGWALSPPVRVFATSLSADTANGSCWVSDADHNRVVHLSASGTVLLEVTSLLAPREVAANSADGTCWVSDSGRDQVVHLAADGAEIWRGQAFLDRGVTALAVSPSDGSWWAAGHNAYGVSVVHFSADGATLGEATGGFHLIPSLSVDPADGSCWAGVAGDRDMQQQMVVHFAPDGTELWRVTTGNWENASVSVDTQDGSCWALANGVRHIAADGTQLTVAPSHLGDGSSICANPGDHTAWASPAGSVLSPGPATHYASDGTVLWEWGGFISPGQIGVDPQDGSCWIADGGGGGRVVHLAANADQLWSGHTFLRPRGVSVDTADGSCWIADTGNNQVVRVDSDGRELARVGGFSAPQSVAADPRNHSCWVADTGNDSVVHLSASGAELWRGAGYAGPYAVAVDADDGACWVADSGNNRVVLLNPDGTERWSVADVPAPSSLSVDQTDGSCWVGDAVIHLSASGEQLVDVTITGGRVSADETDGSCWVANQFDGHLQHVGADGTGLGTGSRYGVPTWVAADPRDGTVWLGSAIGGDAVNGWIRHFAPKAGPLAHFVLSPPAGAAPLTVQFTDASQGLPTSWLWDFGDGGTSTDQHPSHTYTTAGWYAVSLTIGTPGGTDTVTRDQSVLVTFADLGGDSWAFLPALDCLLAGIVQGYPGGNYGPAAPVTRGQMAVYISRALAGGDEAVQVPTGVAEPTFGDVGEDHWAYRYVEYCKGAGVVQGYPDGGYHPDETVNRGQMAVYVARAVATPTGDAAVPEDTDGATFTDVTTDGTWSWCYRYVEYCAANDIVQGYWDGTYHPEREVTRDQMAVYVARAFALPK
jgi:PKD repeat protein